MTKKEILNILNPNNTRLDFLAYDKYEIILLNESIVVGCFDFASVVDLSNNNTWKILLASNPLNLYYEGQDSVILNGKKIIHLKRL